MPRQAFYNQGDEVVLLTDRDSEHGFIPRKISRVTYQPFTQTYMYQFGDYPFAVGEMHLRDDVEDALDRPDARYESAVDLDTEILPRTLHKFGSKQLGIDFFKPNRAFARWIADYAGDRIIFEVGCGTGLLLRMLREVGFHKTIGIEPQWDVMAGFEENGMDIRVLPYWVDDPVVASMFRNTPNCLIIVARPCHSSFVEKTIELAGSHEVLYITRGFTRNLYNDLGRYDELAVPLEHQGQSVDDEKVWSIRK